MTAKRQFTAYAKRISFIALCALLLLRSSVLAEKDASGTLNRVVTKTLILNVPLILDQKLAADEGLIQITPDGRGVAYAYKGNQSGRRVVFMNGKEYGPYTYIGRLKLSPNTKRIAYAAGDRQLDKVFVVVDGKAGKKYDYIDEATITFSPDSERVAYVAGNRDEKGVAMVMDGRARKRHLSIDKGSLIFSPDSKRYAYRCEDGSYWRLVVDGHIKKDRMWWGGYLSGLLAQGEASRPVFSPDGKRIAYDVTFSKFATSALHSEKRVFSFVDGQELGGQFCAFSPNGKKIAYTVHDKKRRTVSLVVSSFFGKKGKEYSDASIGSIAFSPNGKRVAYVVSQAGKELAVVDRTEGKRYESIVEDSITFSPDGTRVAYVASEGGRKFVVIDGQDWKQHDYHWYSRALSRPVFSPDSKRVAFLASDETGYFVVVDGQGGKRYARIKYGSLTFSPDSKHLAYVVGEDANFVVIDETEGNERGEALKVFFDSGDKLHYLLRTGKTIYLIEEKLQ